MRVLITGANRGIGLELTRQLLSRGARVFATCHQPLYAAYLQNLKVQYANDLTITPLDVADPGSIEAAFQAVRKSTNALDLLINNAGVGAGDEPLGEVTQETLLRTYTINAAGPILVAQRFLKLLQAGDQPRIVNLTSGIGSIGNRDRGGMYSYTASKAALNMLNRNLAHDVYDLGITSIVIDPGWVQTDMGGPNAWITVEESVGGMLNNVLDGLALEHSGRFYHYSGDEIDW
ncbi:MAG: SDR family oxidoreductase [Chloroflexi bacterium]|nr:SDR family oxidoreductase [Chloroflexota bacterium]